MDAHGVEEGTDFRPFFDMVIGILFVLLILVAAQIYFQQELVDTVANDAARQEAALRRADIASFLDALADRLRAGGISAAVEVDSSAVLVPMQQVLLVSAAGLPSIHGEAVGRLGSTLAALTGCVTLPRSADAICSGFARLNLDALNVMSRVGALPLGAALARDRFGDLGSAMLSAKLMGDDPRLVAASNAEGGRVVGFSTGPAGSAPAASPGMGGDLVLAFTFR